jgi:acetylornithine aminotransferase/acetylornithine/N-succinyldiaminopimelate aminotransferase
MHPGMHGTTFGGGPLSCAVAIAFLDTLEALLPKVREIGVYFKQKLESLAASHPEVREVRGRGLMLGMELSSVDAAKSVVTTLLGQGIVINRTSDTVLRFLPPYIIQKAHVDRAIDALESALSVPSYASGGQRATSRRTARRSHA